ncbi:MAG: GlxA family transcriptional regulator [Kiloniellales bacterium]|nr:GlxA family transcriptional regulator [Kiloniellales bacterium]
MEPWPDTVQFTPPPAPDVAPELTVGFVLAPNFTLLPVAGFVDALRHAADVADFSRQIHCRWSVLAPDRRPVRASCGFEIMPWSALGEPEAFDYIVVAGGLLPSCLELAEESYDFLRRAAERSVPLIALCTGSFILAAAGLLDGRRCAVHVRHRDELTALFPEVVPVTDETYVVDGAFVTCPGGTAGIDIAAEIIARHCGKARALKSLRSMLVEKHRAAYNIPRRSYEDVADCGDVRIERAVALMEQHISRPFAIARLARLVGTSIGQLDRAFARYAGVPPSTLWRRMRLEHAHWLLTNSNRKITDIALATGFYDATHFSKCFKRAYGTTPRAMRQRSRQAAALAAPSGTR